MTLWFPILFSLLTDKRERAILCKNRGRVPQSLYPLPACTNISQYKMLKKKKKGITTLQGAELTHLNTGCGTGMWTERTRPTEDSEVHSFCCRLYELAEVVDYSSSNGKRRKCHIRLPSTAFLINSHVLVQSTSSKHPFSLLHKDPYYVKII